VGILEFIVDNRIKVSLVIVLVGLVLIALRKGIVKSIFRNLWKTFKEILSIFTLQRESSLEQDVRRIRIVLEGLTWALAIYIVLNILYLLD
jgi:hypothetical protein